MLMTLLQLSLAMAAAFAPQANLLRTSSVRRAAVQLKKAQVDEDAVETFSIDEGSICEFNDPHKANAILGIVQTCESKSKGGARLTILDADGNTHSVDHKAIHISLGAYKGKLKEPSEILKAYNEIAKCESTDLGVEPDVLEMAWEMCADDDRKSFSAKSIVKMIDEKLYSSQLDAYRAFRLLTSDLGKVFFKTLSDGFKPKKTSAVKASKENWCNDAVHANIEQEFCFV